MTTNGSKTMVSNMATSSDENNQIRMLGLDEEDMNRFGKVLRTMNLDNIPNFASTVRQYGHHSTGKTPTQGLSEPRSISCKVINPPLCGSFHIVFPIEFADGIKWMLKVSANGAHFDSVAAAALASEARTMQMLRRETSIPIPAVYAFDTSSNNALLSPFILMEKLGGRPLCHLWFDNEVPKARLEHFRVKVIQSLAGAMVQLNKFTLSTGGSLVFDSDGTPIGLGGAKVVDGVATFNKARATQVHQEDCDEGSENTTDALRVEAAKSITPNASGCSPGDADKSDDEDIICEQGPFSCPKAYFLSNLDRSDPAFRADAYERGTDMSLRLFIEWAFADSRNQDDRRFVLTHPDLDVQNILVAEDGTLTGLIDWDGVAAVPREVGCAQYPLWLMRDWVPLRYKYNTQDAGYEESSPAELASYRALYAQWMEAEIEKMTGGSNKTTTFGTLPKQEAELTRRSLVMRNLDLSAGDPWVALLTVNHIIDQIEDLTAPEWEDIDSDTDSISSFSSDSESDSTVDSDSDEENTEVEASWANEQSLSGMRADAYTHQANQEFGGIQRIMPEVTVNINHSSRGIAEQNQVSTTSSEASRTEFQEPKMQNSSTMDLRDDSATSAPLDWMRRLLRFSCSTAEISLRRIANIGYFLKYAVDAVAEVLAEVKVPHAEAFVERDPGHVVDSDIQQQETAIGTSRDIGTEHFMSVPSAQDAVEPEQVNDIQSNVELHEHSSTQAAVESQQTKAITSVEPTVQAQEIPLRKAELIQEARMEKKAWRKANYRAGKAAIKQKLKVWERIALAVWSRGVPLELLRKNENKIYRWVVDTLEAEQGRGINLAAGLHLPSAAEAVTTATEMEGSSAATLSPLEDAVQSKEQPEEFRPEEDKLQTAKVKGDEPSSMSEVTIASVVGNYGLESKVHQTSLKEPIIMTQDISLPENSVVDIFEDTKYEPESPTMISSTNQPQARFCGAQNPCTSKPNGLSRRAKKPTAAEGGKMSPILGNENPPSSGLSTYTTTSNSSVSTNQPEVPSDEDELAGGPNHGRKNLMLNEEAARNLTKVREVQPLSGPSSESEDHLLPAKAKASYSLRALCETGASYITQILFNDNQSNEDQGCLSPESSVLSDSGEEGGSEVGDAHSSVTSLSDGEAKNIDNETTKRDEYDTPEITVIAVDKGDGDEDDEEPDDEGREEGRFNEAVGQTNHHSHAVFTKSLFKEDGPIDCCAPRRVYDPCSGDWVEANKFDGLTKAESTAVTSDEAQSGEKIDTGDGEVGGDAASEDGQEDRAGEEEGNESSSDGGLPPFEDHGGFDHYTVCNLLGMGELDELRLLRLKDGFLKLLEQY